MARASLLIVVAVVTFAAVTHGCYSPPDDYENYRVNAGLPLPGSKNSDVNTYPNLPRYGTNCGHNKYWNDGESTLIVGGVEAYPNEFPFQVRVVFDGSSCSGSIIHP